MTDSDSDSVDWSLVARDPQTFFGLASGYSRKDLKRSYNRLIRIYKPERAPEEFQRIRGAFELLDNAMRYGEQPSEPALSANAFDWSPAAMHAEATSLNSSEGATEDWQQLNAPVLPPHEVLLARIESTSTRAVYAELSKREQRSPYDYYALAVLSDAIQDDPLKFIKWLLAGLKQYPGERGLMSVLYASLRGSIADDVLPGLLIAVARAVRTDRFYSLTEPLWDRVLQARPFEEFLKLLKKCESELQDYRVEGRVALFMHLLKPAMWIATREWVDETMLFLEENQPEFSYGGDFEMELLSSLREYVEYRDAFLNGIPLRAQMDQAIQDYCLLDDSQCDHAFVECQIRIASSGEEVLKAFPFAPDSDGGSMLVLWEWISVDIADRLPDQIDEPEYHENQSQEMRERSKRVRRFLKSIEARTDASSIGRFWNFVGWIMGILMIGGIYPAIFFPLWYVPQMLIDHPSVETTSLVIGLVAAIGLGFLLHKRWLPNIWGSMCMRFAIRCYARIWRREVQQYLRRSRLSVYEFVMAVEASADFEKMPASTWLMHITQRDSSQHLFVSAQRYLA